ncbi:MAG: hypothetical protein ACOYO2_01785 [Mycobacterium sp.]
MSWFVAACFPGLLMLSAYGLQRLESVMYDDPLRAGDIVARIEHAARTAGEGAAPLSVPCLSDFTTLIEPGLRLLADEPGLPTRPNRLFQPT